jgi:hypothetical protein
MEHGQFNIYTAAGKALLSLIETDSRIVNILDIGSWNGLGTTLCCVLGSIARVEYKPINIIAVEANPEFYEKGLKAWKNRPGKEMVHFLKGRIAESMMTEAEIKAHPQFTPDNPHFNLWYQSDVKNFNESPLLNLQGEIDLAILDGGEYCGFQDYMSVLKHNPKYLLFDDIIGMKNDKASAHALQNGFTEIFRTDEKSGTIILKRTPFPPNL